MERKTHKGFGSKLFGAIKGALGAVAASLGFEKSPAGKYASSPVNLGTSTVSPRDWDLPSDAFVVKRKLGGSFFTRKLNPKTRSRILSGLTPAERAIARERGWIA